MLGLRRVLTQQPQETLTAWQQRLMGYLAQTNAALEAQAQAQIAASLTSLDSGSIDSLVPRSTGPEILAPPSMDRGRPASPFPPPSPLDLLSASSRLGPRLAAKLVAASARSAARKR